MEREENGLLSFLDVLISREGNRLGHKVYRKQTHTDRYLQKNSNHHPSQKRGIIKTLANRARVICQPEQPVVHLVLSWLHYIFQNGGSK